MEDFFGEEYQRQTNQQHSPNNNVPPPPTNTKKNQKITNVLLIFLIIGVFVVGVLVGSSMSTSSELKMLEQVVDVYKNNSLYYDEATWDTTFQQMIVNAGTYLLQTTDSYGFVLSPQELYDIVYPSDGSVSPTFGISFMQFQNVGYYITGVSYGSGAFVSDLRVGDIVLFINRMNFDEVDVRNASSTEVTNILSGKIGTTVTFTVLRGLDGFVNSKSPTNLTIQDIVVTKIKYETNYVDYYFGKDNTDMTTDEIKSKMQVGLLDDTEDVGYIRLNGFDAVYDENMEVTDSSSMQFKSAMMKFKEAYNGKGKLILDLRGNPGGSVDEAVSIASYLIYDFEKPTNRSFPVTTLKDRSGKTLRSYSSDGNFFADYFDVQVASQKPRIAVMTDGNSASASELLLGCMLDYNTGVQIGETTYGKGIAQTVEALNYTDTIIVQTSNGPSVTNYYYGIYYTFAKYYSPLTNTNIHGVGYTPGQYKKVDATNNKAMMQTAIEYFENSVRI